MDTGGNAPGRLSIWSGSFLEDPSGQSEGSTCQLSGQKHHTLHLQERQLQQIPGHPDPLNKPFRNTFCWCSSKSFCNSVWSYFTFNKLLLVVSSSLRVNWPCRCSAQWKQWWEESEVGESNRDQTWAQLKLSSPSVAVVSYCRHSPSDSRALKPDKHWHLNSVDFTVKNKFNGDVKYLW